MHISVNSAGNGKVAVESEFVERLSYMWVFCTRTIHRFVYSVPRTAR